MAETKEQAAEAQQTFFRITDNIPEETWYWAALGSIGTEEVRRVGRPGLDWRLGAVQAVRHG